MRNTLPLSAHVDTSSLICFFIFMAFFCRLSNSQYLKTTFLTQAAVPSLLIRPEKLQLPLRVRPSVLFQSLELTRIYISFVMITSTMFGILIWSLCAARGAGILIHTGPSKRGSILSWNSVYGLQSILGTFASGCLGQSGSLHHHYTSDQRLMIILPLSRLDPLRQNPQRGSIRTSRNCSSDNLHHRSLWPYNYFHNGHYLWRISLEPLRAHAHNSAQE